MDNNRIPVKKKGEVSVQSAIAALMCKIAEHQCDTVSSIMFMYLLSDVVPSRLLDDSLELRSWGNRAITHRFLIPGV